MSIDDFIKIIFYNMMKYQRIVNRKSCAVDDTVFAIFLVASLIGMGIAFLIYVVIGPERMPLDVALYIAFLLLFSFGGISLYLMRKNLLKEDRYKEVMEDKSLGSIKYKIMTICYFVIGMFFMVIVGYIYLWITK